MTKDGSFKRAVRRRAEESGQRYTDALAEFEGRGLDERIWHEPDAKRLVAHLIGRYGIDIQGVANFGWHTKSVFRVDRSDGPAWVARVHSKHRPLGRVQGDAAVLAFLERHNYPAERLATEDPVSEFDDQSVIVTECLAGDPPSDGFDIFRTMGELIGRLHALPLDGSVTREGGAFGHDPAREGDVEQDVAAAMSFLNSVKTDVPAEHRDRHERLQARVAATDVGEGLPEALLHSDVQSDDHLVVGPDGASIIHWQASGRGPRAAEVAWLLWAAGTGKAADAKKVAAIADGYTAHVQLEPEELDRLPGLMQLKPIYLTCWKYWRSFAGGNVPTGEEKWWGYADEERATAIADAFRKRVSR